MSRDIGQPTAPDFGEAAVEVYEVLVNAEEQRLDKLIHLFASRWEHLGDLQTSDQLLADPILVLGPDGTAPVTRADFLAAVAARSNAVSAAPAPQARLAGVTAHALGERMVVATISWAFHSGTTAVTLVSDFLLQREAPDLLRCVAYLPRTNVLDHVPAGEPH
jgi:hypothetical protein